MNLLVSILSWIGRLFGGSRASPAPTNYTEPPPLPIGSVAGIADALTQAGRIAEQQTTLRNTPAMQQAVQAQQAVNAKDKIENDIANQNVAATRRDLAD